MLIGDSLIRTLIGSVHAVNDQNLLRSAGDPKGTINLSPMAMYPCFSWSGSSMWRSNWLFIFFMKSRSTSSWMEVLFETFCDSVRYCSLFHVASESILVSLQLVVWTSDSLICLCTRRHGLYLFMYGNKFKQRVVYLLRKFFLKQ